MAKKKPFEFYAQDIAKNINWENIHKAMVALQWNWYFGKDEYGKDKLGIPCINTIKNAAYDLLKQAYDREVPVCTGGFSVGWVGNEMYLSFAIDEYQTESEAENG